MSQQLAKIDFTGVEKKMAEIMPLENVRRELGFAKHLYFASKDLQECDPNSILAAVVNVAYTKLTLNPIAKEAVLVARWDNARKCKVATFMPQYTGIAKTLIAEGAVVSIISNAVYENDKFSINLADSITPVIHNPALKNRGELLGFYSLATLPDGTKHPEWMDADTINQIREKSDGYKAFKDGKIKSNPWDEWYTEMGRKAVLKRHCKWLPRARCESVTDKLIELDNTDYGASQQQYGLIETLLDNANISEAQYLEIEGALMKQSLTSDAASYYIRILKENQSDPMQRKNQSMSEVNAAVRAKLDDPDA